MADYKRKRLNMNVKKYFQHWLLKRILGAVFLSSLIAALVLYFYARNEITTSFFDAHIKIRRVSDLLLPVVVTGSIVSLISGIVISLFLPQKIAGPIYRIEQGLQPLQGGDLTTVITLREGDILTELAEEINKMASATRGRVQESKEALAALIEAMETTEKDQAVQSRIQDLKNALDQLKVS